MPTTGQATDIDYSSTYLYRTYEMVLGGNAKDGAGATYYGSIRA